jgi:hypothetical protein
MLELSPPSVLSFLIMRAMYWKDRKHALTSIKSHKVNVSYVFVCLQVMSTRKSTYTKTQSLERKDPLTRLVTANAAGGNVRKQYKHDLPGTARDVRYEPQTGP